MKNILLLCLWIFVVIFLFFQSCVKEEYDFKTLTALELNPDIAIPLAKASLTISDLLAQHEVKEITTDAKNLIILMYEGNIYSLIGNEIVSIPDQIIPAQTFAPGLSGSGWNSFNNSVTAIYNFDATTGVDVDSLIIKSGLLKIDLSSDFQHKGNLIFTMPTMKKNGIPFSQTIIFDYTGGAIPVTKNPTWELVGYTVDMTGGIPEANEIQIDFEFNLTEISGNPVNASDQFTINVSFESILFSALFGYVGQRDIIASLKPATIKIYENTTGGSFDIINPKISLFIRNSYGLPIEGSLAKFRSYNSVDSLDLSMSPNPLAPLVIDYPSLSEIGQTITSTIIIDRTNSNLRDIIRTSPYSIAYELANALTNPAGNTSIRNFILDTSKFVVDIGVEVPFYGSASGFVLETTIPFKLGFNGDILTESRGEIEELTFKITTENGFPLDITMQLYFEDSITNQIYDSLIHESDNFIIKSGIVGPAPDYKVTQSTLKYTTISVNKTRLDEIAKANRLIIKGLLETTDQGSSPVKIYADYTIGIKIGVRAKAKIKLDL